MKQYLVFILFFFMPVAYILSQDAQDVKVGQLAPDFELVSLGGDTISASDLQGKITLINIFATWCKPCLMELPRLKEEIFDKYKKNKNFNLIIIGRNHTDSEIAAFKNTSGLDMPFYADKDKASFNFASKSIPRNYIIDKDGYIYYASKGYSEEEFNKLVLALKQLIK
jgi:thiol-disulfide isomerase/thioredoxin